MSIPAFLCVAAILDTAMDASTTARNDGVRTARARVASAELRCHSPSRLASEHPSSAVTGAFELTAPLCCIRRKTFGTSEIGFKVAAELLSSNGVTVEIRSTDKE
jgi:hypothetical protein